MNEFEEEFIKKAKDELTLKHWKQIEGPAAYTYEYFNPKNKCRWVCHSSFKMTEDQLIESMAAQAFLNPVPMEPGEMRVFKGLKDPAKAVKKMVSNPTAKWIAAARQAVASSKFTGLKMTSGGVGGLPAAPSSIARKKKPANPPAGSCPQCHGRGWVCEDHPHVPWKKKVNKGECPCGAPEMACRTCNPKSAIVLGPGDFILGGAENCSRCQDQRWLCAKHNKPWKLEIVGCDCGPGKPCPACNSHGGLKLCELKIIRSGLN